MPEKKIINTIKTLSVKKQLLAGIFVFIIMLSFLLFTDYGLLTRFDLELKKINISKEIDLERVKTKELKELKETLKSNSVEIERIAREKYGYIRKGEEVYFIDTSTNK
jgi:cell division protein FtsB